MGWHLLPQQTKLALTGNRAGKTQSTGAEIGIRSTGIIPPSIERAGGLPGPIASPERPLHFVCSALNHDMSEKIQKAAIRMYLPPSMFTEQKALNRDTLTNGTVIDYRSAEAGRDKYQGYFADGHWLDEEHPEDIYRECRIRNIDRSGLMIITMTAEPEKGLTWTWRELLEPIRRGDSTIGFANWSTFDNPYIPREAIEAEMKKMTPAQIRCKIYGEMLAAAGTSPFGEDCLERANTETREPKWREGPLAIWEEATEGHEYVLGADPSEGLGQDLSVGVVFDRDSGEQVAEYASPECKPDHFALVLRDLGERYGWATICCERNLHGHTVNTLLKLENYPRLWTEKRFGTVEKRSTMTYGYLTTMRTKPLAINSFARLYREGSLTLRSKPLVEEMWNFRQTEDGLSGIEGCHDDRVMAASMASIAILDMRGLVPSKPLPPKRPGKMPSFNEIGREIDRRKSFSVDFGLWR